MDFNPNRFSENAVIALQDIQMRGAVTKATSNADGRRRQMMGELDSAALRQQGRQAKLRALANLPELLEKMESNVSANGGKVLWAQNSSEALQHILSICQSHNLKRGVKSKSMVTEEIGLIPFFKQHGIEMVETDLGEYIVQINESHPSHIVMPVMHMTKGQIRDLFMEKLDMPHTDSAEDMTAFARKILREEFLSADFGMSGGNFMIAETGTVAIVTNEGNGRLSTGMPRVHIAVVGIEKLVASWDDFATLVQLLPRSATGQRMTVYVNMFGGPARAGEPDGPEHFYLILLDNGRSNIYATEYAEALACIRCGACSNVCPIYKAVSGHSYGSVYNGPIGSILTPLFDGAENAKPLPYASSLCGACKQACPVDIDIPEMLLKLRRDNHDQQEAVWRLGMKAWEFGTSRPSLYGFGGKAASLATRAITSLTGKETLSALPYPLHGWTRYREFPSFAPQSFHEWWKKNRKDNQ